MHLACLKMTSKRLLDKSPAGVRGTGAAAYGENYCTKHREHFSPKAGGVLTRKKSPVTINGFDPQTVDTCSLQEPSKEPAPTGNQLVSVREKHYTKKKVSNPVWSNTTSETCAPVWCRENRT